MTQEELATLFSILGAVGIVLLIAGILFAALSVRSAFRSR